MRICPSTDCRSRTRSQLAEQNGGAPVDYMDVPLGSEGSTDLDALYGIDMPDENMDFAHNVEVFRGRIPPGMCPIAVDAGGNLFLIETADPRDGAIWFWDHEKEYEPDPVTQIASSLGEFLAGISLDT